MSGRRSRIHLLVLLALGACGNPDLLPEGDGGGHVEAGADRDAGGRADAQVHDDAGPESDAGAHDAGALDAGAPDAGPQDAGPPDAGPPDAGPSCPDDDCVPAAWLGSIRAASGTCTGYAVFHSSCAMGCCSSTGALSELATTIQLEILEQADGNVLHVTHVDVAGDAQPRDASSAASTTARFVIDPFFFRAGAISLSGPLTTSADDEGLHLGFSGNGYGGGGTCGATEVYRTCQWHLAP